MAADLSEPGDQMKKAVVDFAAGGLRTAPQVADNAFNWRVFEANAQAYLFKQITAEVFAEACGEALNSPLAVPYGHTIYKYRYLALMEQGRYYEAFLDAQVIGTVFHDELTSQQMLCSIYLNRGNFDRALDAVGKMLNFARRHGLDMADLLAQRSELKTFARGIDTFEALDFCRLISRNPEETRDRYAGRPVRLIGRAFFALNKETGHPFLIFNLPQEGNDTGLTHIYGQTEQCEIPFLHGLKPDATITMLGYYLGAVDTQALFGSCHFVD